MSTEQNTLGVAAMEEGPTGAGFCLVCFVFGGFAGLSLLAASFPLGSKDSQWNPDAS